MENKERDNFFYINWEDSHQRPHRIGLIAQIDNVYYLKMNNKENATSAYNHGCIGIPGFQNDRVYRSEELFDFFKRRILKKESQNVFEELRETQGRSMVDSFFVEEVPERLRGKCKQLVLDLYRNQEEMDKIIDETLTPSLFL